MKNARTTEDRINDVVRHRAGNVKEILEGEQESARVRGEIERMESERQVMEARADFATISLTLTEEYRARLQGNSVSAGTRLRNAFVTGLSDAGSTVVVALVLIISVVPTLALWIGLFYLPFRWSWRRWRAAFLYGAAAK